MQERSRETAPLRARVLPPHALLLALLAQLPLMLANRPLSPSPLELAAGIALIVAGLAVSLGAARIFRKLDTGVVPFSPVSILVRSGPYRWTRNPMYLGIIAIALGTPIATSIYANLWTTVALALFLHYAFVLREERFLRGLLGDEFDAYARQVPRWLGPVSRIRE